MGYRKRLYYLGTSRTTTEQASTMASSPICTSGIMESPCSPKGFYRNPNPIRDQ